MFVTMFGTLNIIDKKDFPTVPGHTNLSVGIYNSITAMGFSAMFTFQLDNTKW